MGKIVKTTDFVGKYKVSQNNFAETDLQSFIDKFEKVYIRRLLGLTTGDLFYADIASLTFLPPSNAIYSVLFNPIATVINGCDVISNGVKEMLVGFIYWEYTRLAATQNTLNGNVIQENETASQVDFSKTPIYSNYNEAVYTYSAIQYFIMNDDTNYPDYNGKDLQLTSPFI